MANQHKLGAYVANPHNPQQMKDYLSKIQPNCLRILMPGDAPTQLVSDLWVAAGKPKAINPRWWDIDDGGEGNKQQKLADVTAAEAAGVRDAKEMVRRCGLMGIEAHATGIPWPETYEILLNAMNEPPTWENKRAEIATYNMAFAEVVIDEGYSPMVGEFAVGHPHEWPPVWDWFGDVLDYIDDRGGSLGLHEYWQPEGPFYEWTDEKGQPRKDWGALAGRYLHLDRDVPIIISECGVDGRIFGRHATPDTGYLKFMNPVAYAAQVGMYLAQIKKDERIYSATPFITDFADKEWASFDTLHAVDSFKAVLDAMDKDNKDAVIRLPVVGKPGSTVTFDREDFELVVDELDSILKYLKEGLDG